MDLPNNMQTVIRAHLKGLVPQDKHDVYEIRERLS